MRIKDEFGYQVRRGEAPVVDIQVILEEFGWPMVARLLAYARGNALFIPRNPDDLTPALGATYAARLCARHGGRRCLIPADSSLLFETRDLAVRADHKAGRQPRELLDKYQLNEQALLNVLRMTEG